MDTAEQKKKYFDVTPPPAKQPAIQPRKGQIISISDIQASPDTINPMLANVEKVEHHETVVEPPSSGLAQPIKDNVEDIEQPTEPVGHSENVPAESEEANDHEQNEGLAQPVDITAPKPDDETISTPVATPILNPLPTSEETSQESAIQADIQPDKTLEPEDKDMPVAVPDSFSASDGLPDDSQKLASSTQQSMQSPTIYDTTAYHVPIKETVHGHGALKASITFGVLCAVVVVGITVFILVKIGS